MLRHRSRPADHLQDEPPAALDANGHRRHAADAPTVLARRAFMTRMFAVSGAVAFGSMVAACGTDDSTSAASTASGSTGSTGSGPPSGGPGGGGPGGMSEGITEEFVGVTTDGAVVDGLFSISSTGVDTSGVVDAASAWLASLSAAQRKEARFAVDPADYTQDEWRLWSNVDSYERQGISLQEMSQDQQTKALGIMAAGLSAKGLENAEAIRHLNTYGGQLVGNTDQFNEQLYWFTLMGTPSTTKPWGWQIDGHHLVINYFVLGDQVVMTPTFMGSEPVSADQGLDSEYEGLSVFDDEFAGAVAMIQSLDDDQRSVAVISTEKSNEQLVAGAFNDNAEMAYEGIVASDLDDDQLELLWSLAGLFVGNVDDGHAQVTMDQVRDHEQETYFAWVGDTTDDAVFYFRIQSPVILIEFDCQGPGPLGRTLSDGPSRQHVHAITRTPNGNDYGKALLALHLALDH